MALIVRVLVPSALLECRSASSELAAQRQEEQVRRELRSQEGAIREVDSTMRELLRDSATFGLEPAELNRFPQKLSMVVSLAGLKLKSFNRGELQPVLQGDEEIGQCLRCSLDVLGDYPSLLRFLWLQKERLPCLRLIELKVMRAPARGQDLSIFIAFAAPMFGESLAQAGEPEGGTE